ncbi:MAG: DUF4230 domain-containing protein [Lunatimonas sp.]|uniref:DUF4230 domain-containing protein n=1 Tax=Lunatimonas sp. TaxID=2060141 RepID=UPI00263B3DE5|nr:DUF4230 domain-containing protein [Lunatimonas sp.]MCC5938191.1 DUF4230 domain-containing protein [Lunatimonas sp.]
MKTCQPLLFRLISLLVVGIGLFACKSNERELVVGKIQQASDLVTSEFVVDKVVFGKKTKKVFFIPVNEASFLAYSQATVKTGIDLSRLAEKDIDIQGTKITLSLPPIEVINFSYPPDKFVEDTLISNPSRFLNSISLEDQEEFFRMAETDIRESLPYLGIVKTSQEHTRKMMNSLLRALGFTEIYIHFANNELILRRVEINEPVDTVRQP